MIKQRQTTMAALLLLGSSLAHASPTATPAAELLEIIQQWLSPYEQQQIPGICPEYPKCPPDLAPAPQPEQEVKQE